MSKIKITVLQTDIIWENPEENIKNINRLVLSQPGSDVYVLPEMFNTGFTDKAEEMAESDDGYTLERIKEISRISGAAICGSLILRNNGHNYNSFVFVKPDGSVTKYNKRHLFGYGGEAEMFTAGTERVVVEYLGWKILLQICYDLRFPVWSRNSDDYDLMIYVANWPSSRRKIHDILVRARAIENVSYLIACNRIGVDGKGISYNGGSTIIDFKGETVANVEDNVQNLITSELDKDEQNLFRKSFPALKDRDNFNLNIN
jgi:omega-amidase